MRSVTFKCYDTIAIDRWCEITVTVKELPAMGGMEKRYDVTYVARYPGKAADYATLHPLAPRPTADTDGVMVPVQPATTELVHILFDGDEKIIERAGRQLAALPRSPRQVRERAASARRAVAMRALAEFRY